jgi:hypothetical protein
MKAIIGQTRNNVWDMALIAIAYPGSSARPTEQKDMNGGGRIYLDMVMCCIATVAA